MARIRAHVPAGGLRLVAMWVLLASLAPRAAAAAQVAAAPDGGLSIVSVRCFLSPEGYVQNLAYKLAEWPAGKNNFTWLCPPTADMYDRNLKGAYDSELCFRHEPVARVKARNHKDGVLSSVEFRLFNGTELSCGFYGGKKAGKRGAAVAARSRGGRMLNALAAKCNAPPANGPGQPGPLPGTKFRAYGVVSMGKAGFKGPKRPKPAASRAAAAGGGGGSYGRAVDPRTVQCSSTVSGPISVHATVPGRGFDILKGNPLRSVVPSSDATILGKSIFNINDKTADWMASSQCGADSSTFESTSAQQLQESAATSVGVDGSYGRVAFSASVGTSSTTSTATASTAYTAIATGTLVEGVYTLKGLTDLTLDDDFVASVKKLLAYDAAGDQAMVNDMLRYIYSNYGTHYVQSATVGGRYGVITKMSSQARDSLTEKGISVSAEVSASFLVASGSVSASYENSNAEAIQQACKEGSFSSFYAPAGVTIPFKTGGRPEPDCAAWKSALDAAASYAVVGIKVDPLINVFSFQGLWQTFLNIGELTSAQLARAKTLIQESHTSCTVLGDSSCPQPSGTCNPGFFGYGGSCQSCYSAGDRCAPSFGCDSSTGACKVVAGTMQQGLRALYAGDYKSYGEGVNFADSSVVRSQQSLMMTEGTSSGRFTFMFTGYFSPPETSDYYFTLEGTPQSAFWIDPGSPNGALSGPTESNALIKSQNCIDWPYAARTDLPNPWIRLERGKYYAVRMMVGDSGSAAYKTRVRVTSKAAEQRKRGSVPATCDYYDDNLGDESCGWYQSEPSIPGDMPFTTWDTPNYCQAFAVLGAGGAGGALYFNPSTPDGF